MVSSHMAARTQYLRRPSGIDARHAWTIIRGYGFIRTVQAHLDRIRDKTGARRRADLTGLALNAD